MKMQEFSMKMHEMQEILVSENAGNFQKMREFFMKMHENAGNSGFFMKKQEFSMKIP